MAKTATLSVPYTDADDSQIWLKGTGADSHTWSPTISGLPSGAKIQAVTLSFTSGYTYDKPGNTYVYWGTSADGTRLWSTSGAGDGSTYTVDLTPYVTGNGKISLYFRKTKNSGGTNSNVYFSGVKIVITYEKPGSLLQRAEGGSTVTYALYHAENGSLVRYNAHRAENGALVKY